mmetsp:Transcript_18398/g.40768  ORF Transcript_18398/g.40768 Transcript_18398/m.40768 type:complete len:411 (-) Transcript_18398:646-1878(-)
MVQVPLLHRLVGVGVGNELVVLPLGRGLLSLGVRLQASKIGLDDLQHAKHTATLSSHAGVRLLGGAASLNEASGLLVEVPQHRQSLGQGHLRPLGIPDGLLILLLLAGAVLGGLLNRLRCIQNTRLQVNNILVELGDGRLQPLDVRLEGIHSISLRVSGLLVRPHLLVAPALVLRFLIGRLQKPADHVLDHLLHLHERVRLHGEGELGELLAPELLGPAGQQCRSLPPCGALHQGHGRFFRVCGAAQLGQARPDLDKLQVLLAGPGHVARGQDLVSRFKGLQLLRSELLGLLILVALGGTIGFQVRKVLLVCSLVLFFVLQLALGNCKAAGLLLCQSRLAFPLALGPRHFVVGVGADHLKGVLRVELFFLQVPELSSELVLQALEHFNDTAGLEVIGRGVRGVCVSAILA